MVTYYDPDYVLIGLVLIVSAVAIVQIIRNRHEVRSYKYGSLFLIIGFLFVLFSTIGNCLVENKWEFNYIISFLFFEKSEQPLFFRDICSWGYIFLSIGMTLLSVARGNKK